LKPDKSVLVGVSIVFAAFLIVVGIGLFGSENIEQNLAAHEQAKVELPGYLESGVSTNGSRISSPMQDTISFAEDDEGNKIRLLSVTGEVTKTVSPDQAEITISVETTNKSAKVSQTENAEIAEKVRAALLKVGINEEDIKTTGYYLNEQYEWDQITQKSKIVGYQTTNTILVTVKDLDATGSVIDAAVDAGANNVSGVRFTLSRQMQDSLRTEALKEAGQNAREKATSIAEGLGISISQVYSASENSGYSYPTYYKSLDYATAGVGAEDSRAPTPITPGDVEFSASIYVQFEIR